jgi:hypothetical protein
MPNMSQLSLYCPPVDFVDDEPRLLSFTDYAGRVHTNRVAELIDRARLQKQNTQCPCCHRVTVTPLELSDGVRNRNGALVPGTATIVAFRCGACCHEWPVRDRA